MSRDIWSYQTNLPKALMTLPPGLARRPGEAWRCPASSFRTSRARPVAFGRRCRSEAFRVARRGTICHGTPNLSASQPQRLFVDLVLRDRLLGLEVEPETGRDLLCAHCGLLSSDAVPAVPPDAKRPSR